MIYRVENGLIRPILNNKSTAGLAGYVDKKNCLTREGIVRLISVLREFAGVMSLLPDCPVYPFATASLRNIANTSQVLETVWRETGLGIQVLSGQEEALLDYRGAIRRAAMDTGCWSTWAAAARSWSISATAPYWPPIPCPSAP